MAFLSSKTPLTGNATYASDVVNTLNADRIVGTVFADQGGTLYIEQSPDGTNWDISTSYTLTSNDGKGFSEEVLAPFFRVRVTNGATPQTAFRVYAKTIASGPQA